MISCFPWGLIKPQCPPHTICEPLGCHVNAKPSYILYLHLPCKCSMPLKCAEVCPLKNLHYSIFYFNMAHKEHVFYCNGSKILASSLIHLFFPHNQQPICQKILWAFSSKDFQDPTLRICSTGLPFSPCLFVAYFPHSSQSNPENLSHPSVQKPEMIPLLSMYPKELKGGTLTDVYAPIFTAALFHQWMNGYTKYGNRYNGIFSNKKERSSDICYNIDEPGSLEEMKTLC